MATGQLLIIDATMHPNTVGQPTLEVGAGAGHLIIGTVLPMVEEQEGQGS